MSDWEKIQTFMYPQDAYLAKALLESNGIEVFLKDEMTTQVFNFYSNAIGGVKLLVPTTEAKKAFEILKDGGYILPEKESADKIEILPLEKNNNKNHCPYCHSSNITQEKKPNWLTIGFIFLLGLILPITSKTFICFDCNKKWKFK